MCSCFKICYLKCSSRVQFLGYSGSVFGFGFYAWGDCRTPLLCHHSPSAVNGKSWCARPHLSSSPYSSLPPEPDHIGSGDRTTALRLSPPRVNQPCRWAARACWAGQAALLARPQLGQTRIHITDSPTRYDCSHVPPYAARFDSLIQISGI
jgi:hypothetical protein